jgi:hypothetical protein
MDVRRLACALSWRCFQAGRHKLLRAHPTVDPAVPSSLPNAPEVHASSPRVGLYPVVSNREKHIGRAKREIMAPVFHINYFFKSPMYMAFSKAVYPADRAVLRLSPCRAKLDTATGFPAPTTGRRGNADGHVSEPPSGVADAAPPACAA